MRRPQEEAGFTLVELLTVLALSSVVLAFVTGTVVHALQTQRRQLAEVTALDDSKVALERVTRDLRGADPLLQVALDQVRLDVNRNGTTRTVTYDRAGDAFQVTDAATGQTRTLVAGLASGEPLFVFHLADGSSLTGDQVLDPRSVESVTVHLVVQPGEQQHAVDLESDVRLRNTAA